MRHAIPIFVIVLSVLDAGVSLAQEPGVASVWPECVPGQVRVLLLGTYHMDNPGRDVVNVEADDVRSARRQREIRDLVDRLSAFAPQRVMVEWPYGSAERVDSLYDAIDLSREETTSRNEVVQVGFRLAQRLNHETVHPVDYRLNLSDDSLRAFRQRGGRTRTVPGAPTWSAERLQAQADSALARSTIVEYLRHLNQEEPLRSNHWGMFGGMLGAGEADNFGGPGLLATWYRRNLNIVHNILRNVEPGDERIFVLMGAGHIRALRHMLDEAPQFCPVSPLPYLR